MLDNNPAGDNANISLLSGQGGSTSNTATEIQGRVTDAARQARQRIAALAKMSAYGGSFNGMGMNAAEALQRSGQEIGLQGNLRNGNTQTLKVAQAVPVQKFQAGPDIAGGLASGLAQIAGSAMTKGGKLFGNAY
jgi:hypothetical protein